MEEILIAIVAGSIELVAEILAGIPWQLLLELLYWIYVHDRSTSSKPTSAGQYLVLAIVVGTVLGTGLGGLSLLFLHRTLLHNSWIRIANIVVAPVLSGLLAQRVTPRTNAKGMLATPRLRFAFSSTLTFSLVLVRFVFAVRPA
jgi:hypothetical protein